ncbi:helix-turn-helix domain-containing protein [Tenggerimyces flavus]|uniref:Helix-turn-helix domain-containing protein n=1 Tax=Tenggerimyces flavus TaxID=1708749 RepID=A0ABV7Y3H7_9ACTN|nr:helix-turn-helix domain-containing protein [Tenggerimyces flavus]MBM7790777.1 AraC-like DNA-binding protein [Tenggerimyces flavus]
MTCRVVVRFGVAVAHYPPKATYGPRVLDDFEFVWMLSGSARWECGDLDLPLRPGTLLLARPGMRHRFAWDPRRPTAHAYAHFSVPSRGLLPAPDTWPLTRALTPADPMAALCRYLLWLSRTPGPATAERANDMVGCLLDLFVAGPLPSDESVDGLPEHVERLVDHVQSAWRSGSGEARALSLAELATAARVSSGHLSRLFRERFAVGPVAAIELVRLARAATLLQRSNLSVGAVSESCGFANPFHFSRRFSSAYGASPRAYRAASGEADPLEPVVRAGLLPLAHRLLLEDA